MQPEAQPPLYPSITHTFLQQSNSLKHMYFISDINIINGHCILHKHTICTMVIKAVTKDRIWIVKEACWQWMRN